MRTYGAEFEVPGVFADYNARIAGADVHNDGSIRVNTFVLDTACGPVSVLAPIVGSNNPLSRVAGLRRTREFGYELVAGPYNSKQALLDTAASIAAQFYYAERLSPTASIHIHVGDTNGFTWQTVRNLCEWVYTLEAPLFRVACAGTTHRGVSNDYRYTRPLSRPIHVHNAGTGSSKTRPCIDLPGLMDAKSAADLLRAWSRIDLYWYNMPRFYAARTHMINLLALQKYGTIEWRLFDGLYSRAPIFCEIVDAVHNLAEAGRPAGLSPKILGYDGDMTCEEFSSILGLDVSSVWGTSWCPEPQKNIESHYGPTSVHFDAPAAMIQVSDIEATNESFRFRG